MQDFLDDLEQRLSQLAAQDAPAPAPARSPRNFRRRRPAVLGGLTAALAAAAAAFTMTGTSLADLPILSTDPQDASQIASAAPEAAKAGVDFSKAHAFGTPGGPGYALVNRETDAMCVAVPDPEAAGDYGVTCKPSIAAVEREGMWVGFIGEARDGQPGSALHVVVLPEDAEDVVVRSAGKTTKPAIESGVAVVTLDRDGTLTWTVDGRPATLKLPGPFKSTGLGSTTCPDGRRITVKTPTRSEGAAGRARFAQSIRDACRR